MNLRRSVDINTWVPQWGRAHKQSQNRRNRINALILSMLLIASPLHTNAMTFSSVGVVQALGSNVAYLAGSTPDYSYSGSGMVRAAASPVTPVTERPTSLARVVPKLDQPVVLEGEASYYSRTGCLGCNPLMIMANGQALDDSALTMAIGADRKHLVGYRARVTNLVTDQSVVVTITDTGGFYKERYGNRVADLTIASKTAIGMYGGVGQVRVEVLHPGG